MSHLSGPGGSIQGAPHYSRGLDFLKIPARIYQADIKEKATSILFSSLRMIKTRGYQYHE